MFTSLIFRVFCSGGILFTLIVPNTNVNATNASVVAMGKYFFKLFPISDLYYTFAVSGLIEISKALQTNSLTVLAPFNSNKNINMNAFLKEMFKSNMQTCIFTDLSKYLEYIRRCQDQSVATSSLIFDNPKRIVPQV